MEKQLSEDRTTTANIQIQTSREWTGTLIKRLAELFGAPTTVNGGAWVWEIEDGFTIAVLFTNGIGLHFYTFSCNKLDELVAKMREYPDLIPASFLDTPEEKVEAPEDDKKTQELSTVVSIGSHSKFHSKKP